MNTGPWDPAPHTSRPMIDLTRHGMVIAGHATQGLPQVLLELRGDEIWAVGMMALIYGFSDNEVNPTT